MYCMHMDLYGVYVLHDVLGMGQWSPYRNVPQPYAYMALYGMYVLHDMLGKVWGLSYCNVPPA